MRRVTKNKNIFIMLLFVALFVISTGYAIYQKRLTVGGITKIDYKDWNIQIVSIETVDSSNGVDVVAPSHTNTTARFNSKITAVGGFIKYKVIVKNIGIIDGVLGDINISEVNNSVITYEVTGTSVDDELLASEEVEIYITATYDAAKIDTATTNTSSVSINLAYVQLDGYVPQEPEVETVNVDDLKTLVVTSGDGLYVDTYEQGRYIYKGADPSNYLWLDENGDSVQTNTEIYRIVAIEEDNALKVVRENSIGTMQFDTTNGRYNSSGYCNNENHGCNAWGSKTTMLDANGNNITVMAREAGSTTTYELPEDEAPLNVHLNTTFYDGLSLAVKNVIVSHLFNVGHLKNVSGQTFQTDIAQEKAYKWRGNIGLINPSDYVKASTNTACTSVHVYRYTSNCYNNSDTHNYLSHLTYQWVISPFSSTSPSNVWSVVVAGSFNNVSNINKYGTWPAFYLSSNVTLAGNGTADSPYVIS